MIDALGLAFWNSSSLQVNFSATSPNCTVTTGSSSPPSSVYIPSYRGNLSNGQAAIWLFSYYDPVTSTEAAVFDAGTPTLLATIGGPNCIVIPAGVHGIPGGVLDSSIAAQVLEPAGLGTYLSANPSGLSLVMVLGPNFTNATMTETWTFDYTPCTGLLGGNITGPANGTAFYGSVNANSGAVLGAGQNSVSCTLVPPPPPPPPLGSVFALGGATLTVGPGTNSSLPLQGCTSGDYCYEIPIVSTSGNVTPSELSFEVLNSSGQVDLLVTGYAITNPSGQVLLYSFGQVEYSWNVGLGTTTTPLSVTDMIWVDMGTNNPAASGLSFVVQGQGIYAGSSLTQSLP